jgi:hypothetical protein
MSLRYFLYLINWSHDQFNVSVINLSSIYKVIYVYELVVDVLC